MENLINSGVKKDDFNKAATDDESSGNKKIKSLTQNWSIFDNWTLQETSLRNSNSLSWSFFDDLNISFNKTIEIKYKELLHVIEIWDDKLKDFGKDPTHTNWNNFRPLKLSREEDWSDWLAFLIETSESGFFAFYLLNQDSIKKPRNVFRELVCGNFRADIVINWEENNYSHIEVKIGDENLLKTFATSLKLEERFPFTNWQHFILTLSDQSNAWNELNEFQTKKITLISWEEVAIALRKTILVEANITWKVWAYSYIGVIEQNLIGFKGHLLHQKPNEKVEVKLEILKNSLKYE